MFEEKKILENFRSNWENQENFIMMPFTMKGRLYLSKVLKDISIKCILDNDETLDGLRYQDVPIYRATEYLQKNRKCKVLVSSHYEEISKQLNQYGLVENIDYIDMHQFISLWYWQKKREVHLLDVHIAITTHCSLNCRNCNMFMNYYDQSDKIRMDLGEFKTNVHSLFKIADFCYQFTILGGEPLLNIELKDMVNWLGENYSNKIGRIEIVTNGTIIPDKEILEVCKKYNAGFSISDYGDAIAYKQKIKEIEVHLDKWNIRYEHNPDMTWKDFYFPRENQKVVYSSVRNHMLNCSPLFRGLNDQRFYYCHIVWSAVKAGLLDEKETDYFDLNTVIDEEKKLQLLMYDLGYMKEGYVSLCEFCGGCGSDNKSIIPAGIQE